MFYSIEKTLLFSTLNSFYKQYRSKIINICTTREENNFTGHGQSDSPGYSAKYGTHSLMSTDLNKIVDFFVVHVSTVGNSCRMEKKGLQTLLEKYSKLIKITTLTTDRHVQIRIFLSREYPEILHQCNVWHFGKSFKKTLSEIAKKRDCHQVSLWIKAIINHLWWCWASSIGNEELIREKWLSVLNHIRGIHSWEDNKLFHKCEYGQLEQERKWLKKPIHHHFWL